MALASGFIPTASMTIDRGSHTTTLLPSGKVLVAGGQSWQFGSQSSAELYDVSSSTWAATGSLATPRVGFTATLMKNGLVLAVGGNTGLVGEPATSAFLASTELYDPAASAWAPTASMATARDCHTATLLPSGKVLVVGGYGNAGYLSSAELYDPVAKTWSSAGTLAHARMNHSAVLLASGNVLIVGGQDAASHTVAAAELYDPVANSWASAGSLAHARYLQTATLLISGKVLVAGGYDFKGTLTSAELYDPTLNTWIAAGSLLEGRVEQSATMLPSGEILVAGGYGEDGNPLASAELYQPTSDTWIAVGSLGNARAAPSSTLLPSGQVLFAGGETGNRDLSSAELFDSAAGAWTGISSLTTVRAAHRATILPTGSVLIVGGSVLNGAVEVYDPTNGVWSVAASLPGSSEREDASATLLPSGKVLVAGGYDPGTYLSDAHVYDPFANTWSSVGALSVGRIQHTAVLLPSGHVLVVGGSNLAGYIAPAEQFDPSTNAWTSAGSLATPRLGHTATLLASGKVLVIGGTTPGVPPHFDPTVSSVEIYDPVTDSWSSASPLPVARTMHSATLLPSGKVLVAGGQTSTGPYSYDPIDTAVIYDPILDTWSPAGSLSSPRFSHTAILLPSGKVLVAGGADVVGYQTAECDIYDPTTNSWSVAPPLKYARSQATLTLMLSGKVLAAGGAFDGSLTSEVYDPGLTPDLSRLPKLSAVSSFLLQSSALVATGSGFNPMLEGGGGGLTYGSPTNLPVVQVQRIDNSQTRFILNDSSVSMNDSLFTGNSAALAGFPAGPVLVRAWVNGIPSAARMTVLAVAAGAPTAPVATGGELQASVQFAAPLSSGGAPITSYTATAAPGGAIASCASPCSTISFSKLDPGTYTFTVIAHSMAGTGIPSSPSNAVLVTKATSTIGLASSLNPNTFDQGTVFAATVIGQTPTGTVQFLDGGKLLCSVPLNANGAATCVGLGMSVGTHAITATYAGDARNNGSASTPPLSQQVNKEGTTSSLTSSLNPSAFGANLQFTGAITGASPTGTMTFSDGSTTLCVATLSGAGTATCAASALPVGAHSIVVAYSGDGNYSASTATLIQGVVAASSTLSLSITPNPAILGQQVQISATVGLSQSTGQMPSTRTAGLMANATPTGIVTFMDGASKLADVSLLAGVATYTTSSLGLGSHTITARYSGDANVSAAALTAVLDVVDPAVAPARLLDVRGLLLLLAAVLLVACYRLRLGLGRMAQ